MAHGFGFARDKIALWTFAAHDPQSRHLTNPATMAKRPVLDMEVAGRLPDVLVPQFFNEQGKASAVHPGHGPRFIKLLDRTLPEWKTWKERLERN